MALLSLIARLGLDKTGFDQGIKSAQSRVDGFASAVKGSLAGAFSAAAIGAFLKGVIDATSRIKDLSEQYGLTTKEIQETDFALKQSGMEFENLGAALTKLGGARRDAVEGNRELRDTFARYGITLADLNNPQKRNYDLLLQLARAMAGMNITARQQVEISDLLGAKASKLANVMNDLANVKPPALFSDVDIRNIDKAMKYLEALKLKGQAAVAPALGTAARTALDATKPDQSGGGFSGILANLAFPKVGMFSSFQKLFKRQMEEDIAQPIQDGVVNLFKDLAKPILGIPQAEGNGGGMFQIDKNAKEQKDTAAKAFASMGLPGADALGRIGAFSGGGQAEVAKQLKAHETILRDIRIALTDRGIKIKEL